MAPRRMRRLRAGRVGSLGVLDLVLVAPLALPAMAVAALLAWLYSWNEFLYARLLTTAENTLPLQVFQAIDRGTRQQMATVAAVLVVPMLPVAAVLQRCLRPGILAGALRG